MWHGRSAVGVTRKSYQKIKIGTEDKLTRGVRTLSLSTLETQISTGTIQPTGNKKLKKDGSLEWVEVVYNEYTESDLAVVKRILGRESSSRSPVLVLNDEAHHAYRIQKEELDEEEELDFEEEDDDDTLVDERESTVWVEGLDRIHKIRKIQFCVDLSATPYFIGRAGKDTGKPFPWTVSDFPLQDAIESGLVKIPQLALRDSTGKDQPAYFRLWDHVLSQMTPSERGGGQCRGHRLRCDTRCTRQYPRVRILLRYQLRSTSGGGTVQPFRRARHQLRDQRRGNDPGHDRR